MLRIQQYQIVIVMLLVLISLTGCEVLGKYFHSEAVAGALGAATVIGIIIFIYKKIV